MVRTGVVQMREALRTVVAKEGIDTVVLVDGGTDSLMRGDEVALGSPMEDMLSIASLHTLNEIRDENKLLVLIGFGVDAYHGVCHSLFLENVAYVN